MEQVHFKRAENTVTVKVHLFGFETEFHVPQADLKLTG